MPIKFEKWQGLGNDFIILDNTQATPNLAQKLCDRHFGIGADGLIGYHLTPKADIAWDFYNSDGSSAQMCGNGIRCFALYARAKGLVDKAKFSVLTLRGIITPEILPDGSVKVDMGFPIFDASKIPVNVPNPIDFEISGFKASAVSMGNPHCLIFTTSDGAALALNHGAEIENSPLFPQKTNVDFINIISPTQIKLNVWERGCGTTLACGTGACAAVVAGVKKGLLSPKVEVTLPGGSLNVEYNQSVFLTGPAQKVFIGSFDL